jgi:hypothetical protein
MLRAQETRGLIRINPSVDSSEENHSKESSNRETGGQRSSDYSVEDLVAALVAKGCKVTPALVGPEIVSGLKSSGRARSADAERKAQERDEKLKKGVKQLNIDAPNDPLAREFLSAAAETITKNKKILSALRAALDNPRLVRIGQRVLQLKGQSGDEVRRALGL